MKIRLIDDAGNRHDCEAESVPRVGERVHMTYGVEKNAPVEDHFFVVKDVLHILTTDERLQVQIQIKEQKSGDGTFTAIMPRK